MILNWETGQKQRVMELITGFQLRLQNSSKHFRVITTQKLTLGISYEYQPMEECTCNF